MKEEENNKIAELCAKILNEKQKEFVFEKEKYNLEKRISCVGSGGATFVQTPPCCHT